MKKKTKVDWAWEAARHHADLTMFHTLIVMCEGGLFCRSDNEGLIGEIIELADEGRQRELIMYNNAISKIKE